MNNPFITASDDVEIQEVKLEIQRIEGVFQQLVSTRDQTMNTLEDFHRSYHLNLSDVLGKIHSLQESISAEKATIHLKHYRQIENELHTTHALINEKKALLFQIDEKLNLMSFVSSDYAGVLFEYNVLKSEITQLEIARETLRLGVLAEYQRLSVEPYFNQLDENITSQVIDEMQERPIDEVNKTPVSVDDKKELKSLYRKACKLAHPDMLRDDLKEKAHEFMVEINMAYNAQDIPRLRRVLLQLEGNPEFTSEAQEGTLDKAQLLNQLDWMINNVNQVQSELERYRMSSDYQLLQEIKGDWEHYFQRHRLELESTIFQLENELLNLKNSQANAFSYWPTY